MADDKPESIPTPTILLVDGDAELCRNLTTALSDEGYRVDVARNEADGVAKLKQNRYGAAILDMRRPVEKEEDALRACHEIDPSLPIIAVIGHTAEHTVRALSQGAFACLTVPYRPEKLKAILHRALDMKALVARATESEAALADSEERYHALMDVCPVGVVVADAEGVIQSCNRAAERLFLYAESELVGEPLTKLIPARYREAHEIGFLRAREGGADMSAGRSVELSGLRKDGQEFPMELTLVSWVVGAVSMFGGMIRDLTERRRANQRLAVQHRITQVLAESPALADATPTILQAICSSLQWEFGAIWKVDESAQVMRCHDIWHRALASSRGLPPDEASRALYGVDVDTPDYLNMSEFAVLCGRTTFAYGVGLPGRVWARGEPAWIPDVVKDPNFPRAPIAAKVGLHGAFAFPIACGGELFGVMEFFNREFQPPDETLLQMFATIGSQIGQFLVRKRAEESLRESEARFRQLVELINAVFWLRDPDMTQTLYVSPGYEEIWGRPCESLYASPRSWMEAIHPEDRQRIDHALGGQATGAYHEEYRIVRPDGSPRWIRDRAFPLHDEAGRVYRIAQLAEDITEQRLRG